MNENQRASAFRKEWGLFSPKSHVQNLIDSYRGLTKPYDSYIVTDGMFIAIEFKRTTSQSINPKEIRDHQVTGLLNAQREGYAGLVLYFLDHNIWSQKLLFAMPIKKFMKIFGASYIGGGKYDWEGSIKINKLQEDYEECFVKRVKQDLPDGSSKKIWDFNYIIDSICEM